MPTAPLHGREALLDEVLPLLQQPGLVTLVGPGGVGKTRLAETLLLGLSGTLVSLHEARSVDEAVQVTAYALGLDADRFVAAAQAAPWGRVVLDNCEQLSPEALSVLEEALGGFTVLATSRRPLQWGAEQVVEVPGLPSGEGDELLTSPAARVFLDAAPRGFEVTDADRLVLARLLDRLEGLPLALRLAAGRLEVVDLATLEDLLDARYLGALRDPDQVGRHASLGSTVAWSWNLLEPPLRDALVACAAYPGTFDLDAARGVLDDPLDDLHGLVRRHLVVVEQGRYRLLEPIRQFAEDRLAEHPRADELGARVLTGLGTRAREWAAQLDGPDLPTVLAQAGRSWAGLTRVIGSGAPDDARAAFAVFAELIEIRGPATQGLRWATTLAARSDVPDDLRAVALAWRCRWHRRTGDVVAAGHDADASVDGATGGDTLARALLERAGLRLQRGFAEQDARVADLEQALQVVVSPALRALLTAYDALSHHDGGRPDAADGRLAEALALADEVGSPTVELVVYAQAGTIYLERAQDPDAAMRALEHARSLASSLGLTRKEGVLLGQLAIVAHEVLGDDARPLYDRAVERLRAAGDPVYAAAFLFKRGSVELRLGDAERARRELVEAAPWLARGGDDRLRSAAEVWLAAEAAGRGAVDDAQGWLSRTASEGKHQQARAFVRCLVVGAQAAERGDSPGVAVALDELEALEVGDARFVVEVASWCRDRLRALATRWRVASDGSWFEAPGADPVDVKGAANRLVLARLLALRIDHEGGTADVDDLAGAGWPGQRLVSRAAGNRVRVALSALRKQGLEDLIDRGDDGWLLQRSIEVASVLCDHPDPGG